MIRIYRLLIGQPQTIVDERGSWRSAIYRAAVAGPVMLHERGLAGDQVADTVHHGTADQAVCCHPLSHYAEWNAEYGLRLPEQQLGPGSVGENWTLSEASEADVCVGDIFRVGDARVQVSGPRYPCTKQERKLKLPGFHRRTIESLRTGFYVRVLTPGSVQAGDAWTLEERLHPGLSVRQINVWAHRGCEPQIAQRLLGIAELGLGWKRIFKSRLP